MAVLLQSPSTIHSAHFDSRTKFIDDTLCGTPIEQDFERLPAILSRLPQNAGETDNDSDTIELDYITSANSKACPGTLPGLKRPVLYTISRLPAISESAISLWSALHNIRPLSADYAGDFGALPKATGCPFARSKTTTSLDLVRRVFNWDQLIVPESMEGIFYGVVFRSKRRPGSTSTDLYRADKLSHEEAVASGGLLMYWYGVPDPITGSNLATCIWTSRDDAKMASRLPEHKGASSLAMDAYQSFELSRYAVVKVRGERKLRIEPWDEGH